MLAAADDGSGGIEYAELAAMVDAGVAAEPPAHEDAYYFYNYGYLSRRRARFGGRRARRRAAPLPRERLATLRKPRREARAWALSPGGGGGTQLRRARARASPPPPRRVSTRAAATRRRRRAAAAAASM